MRMTRTVFALTTFGIGIAAAACSSSKSTGPSAAKLAATFDSLFRVDSAAGSSRSSFDVAALIALNEGATPSSGSVTTDGGALSMEMVGLVLYDTASGAVADSNVYVFGWTSDYSTEVATILTGSVGPDLVPGHRIGVSAERLAGIRALTSRLSTGGGVTSRAGSSSSGAVVFQGTASANADTTSLVVSEGAGTGKCVFENEPFRVTGITSASMCTNQTVTEAFALHFPATAGISAALTHMSLSPSKTVHAPRVLVAG